MVDDPQLARDVGRFAQALDIRGFVMKPVVIRELALLLREILDGRPSAG